MISSRVNDYLKSKNNQQVIGMTGGVIDAEYAVSKLYIVQNKAVSAVCSLRSFKILDGLQFSEIERVIQEKGVSNTCIL